MIRSLLILHPLPGRTDEVVRRFLDHRLLEFGQEHSGALTSELSVATDGSGDVLVTSWFPNQETYERWLANPERNRPSVGMDDLVVEVSAGRTFDIRHSLPQ